MYISTNNITELNEAKLVKEKIRVPLNNTKRHSKPRWEIQIRNLRQRAKMLRQKKNAKKCWDEKSKATQLEQTIQLEDINKNVLTKEERLKRYQHRIKQYRQNETF